MKAFTVLPRQLGMAPSLLAQQRVAKVKNRSSDRRSMLENLGLRDECPPKLVGPRMEVKQKSLESSRFR